MLSVLTAARPGAAESDLIGRTAASVVRQAAAADARHVQCAVEHVVETRDPRDRSPRSASLNRALSRSRGAFVAVVDPGDTLLPGAWRALQAAWSARPQIDAFYGDWLLQADGSPMPRRQLALRFDADAQIYHRCEIAPPALFLRRSVFERIGRWDEWLEELGDEELVLRAIKRRLCFAPLPQVLAASRRAPDAPTNHLSAERAILVREYARPKAQVPSALRLLKAGFAARRWVDAMTGRVQRLVGA